MYRNPDHPTFYIPCITRFSLHSTIVKMYRNPDHPTFHIPCIPRFSLKYTIVKKLNFKHHDVFNGTELKTLEWDILNPDRLINLDTNNKRRTSLI